jgi:hypothetical protein
MMEQLAALFDEEDSKPSRGRATKRRAAPAAPRSGRRAA